VEELLIFHELLFIGTIRPQGRWSSDQFQTELWVDPPELGQPNSDIAQKLIIPQKALQKQIAREVVNFHVN